MKSRPRRDRTKQEVDLLTILRQEKLIREIPRLNAADEDFEPVPIEGKPISEELIEGRR